MIRAIASMETLKPESIMTADARLRSRSNCFFAGLHCDESLLETSGRHSESQAHLLSSSSVGLSVLFLFLLAAVFDPCDSFQSNRQLAFGHRQTTLFLVEPKERTELTPSHFQDSPIVVRHENNFESYVFSASAEGDEEQSDDKEDERPEEEQDDDSSYDGEEEAKAERLDKATKAAALLSRRTGRRPSGKVGAKSTSVGARRIGSASQARVGARSMTRLTDAVKKAASANTDPKKKDDRGSSSAIQSPPSATLSKPLIQTTVETMMQTSASMGLFGEPDRNDMAKGSYFQQTPAPGTVLVQSERSTKLWRPSDRVSVRLATLADDLDIANLRLSVFSDFSPDMRKAFCAKSCQVLSTRRNRGATCIVATVPRYGSIMSQKSDIILGTAECSFHEFEGTSLGRQRPPSSIMYVTEVAVNPTSRRKGIGQKIMESIDQLARMRDVETLYLHVDTNNYGALSLYRRSGYTQVADEDTKYQEFTRSLNLHDGATKGRSHYLLQKDLMAPTWVLDRNVDLSSQKGSLGFEITV